MRAYLHAQHYGNVTRKRFSSSRHVDHSLVILHELEPVVRWTAGDNTGQISQVAFVESTEATSLLLFGISAYGKSQAMNPESFLKALGSQNNP